MGSSVSSVNYELLKKSKTDDIVKLLMPLYYIEEPLTVEEHKLASDSWDNILNSRSPIFKDKKKNQKNFFYPDCVSFFYHRFYSRLFDIYPGAKELFMNTRSNGKFLVKMISLSLSEFDDPEKFEATLIKLAHLHNEKGIKALECIHIKNIFY